MLVAAPHPITRAGVVRLLAAGEPALQVAGEVDSVDAALDAYRLLAPDVVLAHLDLPDPDGLAGAKALRALDPAAVVLVLCGERDQEHAAGALRAGASGWLVNDASGAELARAVLAAAQGGAVLPAAGLSSVADPVAADRPRARGLRPGPSAACGTARSPSGWSISVKTVEKHVGAILRKTGARTAPSRPPGPGARRVGESPPEDGEIPRTRPRPGAAP